MTKHWKRSRITKALTDAARASSFREAEARLDAVHIAVIVGADQATTRAGQAAALTAIATARKCFGRVTLVGEADVPLIAKLPLGATLQRAARRLGARIARKPPARTTHRIIIGNTSSGNSSTIRCWWDRWLSGTRARGETVGDSRLALSGVFAAALAVRQVFAGVLAGKVLRARDATVSLWTPWICADRNDLGPECFDVPDQFWFLGLGHLGQGFVWNLCLLGSKGGRAILQDDQTIGEENEPTSLLVTEDDIGEKKARIASTWLGAAGWTADVIERRHHGDIRLSPDDPPYLLSGLDRIEPRRVMAMHGFDYMIDAGLGHGRYDFEGIQLRVVAKGASSSDLWDAPEHAVGETLSDRQASAAYKDLEKQIGQCGIVSFAEASTSVPFVGAATGALVIAQAIRLASLESTARFRCSSPEMVSVADFVAKPSVNAGSSALQL
ncbi:hypothetical protein ACM43_11115 [Bradyrhizobium sp. CCBAU 45321]|uniref:hypothetical protein n=1 Tax=Bradyrhizobium TaxID=374 RepID=UPI00056C1F79|nr:MULTISPECIES: hypothetical protein [Bradyrhizobium]MDA9545012.1 hypothetical protein [Bradyrhizobium sp. CCBAU 45321]